MRCKPVQERQGDMVGEPQSRVEGDDDRGELQEHLRSAPTPDRQFGHWITNQIAAVITRTAKTVAGATRMSHAAAESPLRILIASMISQRQVTQRTSAKVPPMIRSVIY
jgi:hypothetical protein